MVSTNSSKRQFNEIGEAKRKPFQSAFAIKDIEAKECESVNNRRNAFAYRQKFLEHGRGWGEHNKGKLRWGEGDRMWETVSRMSKNERIEQDRAAVH